jgi:sterol O-acyltransferase
MIKSKSETIPPTLSSVTSDTIDSNYHDAVSSSSLSYPKVNTNNADDNNSKVIFHKLRKLYFKARLSAFDTSNPETNNDAFRGFYTLFWIAMGFYVILTLVHCYEDDGVVLSLGFFRLMSQDTLALLIADLCMIGQTFIVVPLARLMKKGYLHRNSTGIIIQHIYQTMFFFGNLYWVFWRQVVMMIY